MRWLIGIGASGALAGAMAAAWVSARQRGMMTHCRNNLRWLGERSLEALREARLDPDRSEVKELSQARGRAFWQLLWRIKLQGKGKELSPFSCPFVRPDAAVGSQSPPPVDIIDYRGPASDPLAAAGTFILGADRPQNHGGSELNAVILRLQVRSRRKRGEIEEELTGQVEVRTLSRDSPAWQEILQATQD